MIEEARRAEGLEAVGVTGDRLDHAEMAKVWAPGGANYGDPDTFVYNNGGPVNIFFENASDDDFQNAPDVTVRGSLWSLRI